MEHIRLTQYIHAAEERMTTSNDPVHDLAHAKRVVAFAEMLSQKCQVGGDHKAAIIIAAWWHDVSRTITRNPSFILMPFVDDLLSAFMLLAYALRSRTLDRTIGLAIRLMACKSLGTGAILTRLLLAKRNRLLLNILKDADILDAIAFDRIIQALQLAETSRLYNFGYKLIWRWFTWGKHARMHTRAASEYVIGLIKQFIAWLKQPHIFEWHIRNFGTAWTRKSLRRIERVVRKLERHWAAATTQ